MESSKEISNQSSNTLGLEDQSISVSITDYETNEQFSVVNESHRVDTDLNISCRSSVCSENNISNSDVSDLTSLRFIDEFENQINDSIVLSSSSRRSRPRRS